MRVVYAMGLLLCALPLMAGTCGGGEDEREADGGPVLCLDSAYCEDTACPEECGKFGVEDAVCDLEVNLCLCECGTRRTCDVLYGDVKGYLLCQQTEMTCRFYREDQDHVTGIGCNEICSEGPCKQWEEGDPNLCGVDLQATDTSCDMVAHSAVCECERTPGS